MKASTLLKGTKYRRPIELRFTDSDAVEVDVRLLTGWERIGIVERAERRAKEQRIASEKARVPQMIAAARREARAFHEANRAARLAEGHPAQPGTAAAVTVNWKDGSSSTVTLSDETVASLTRRWLKEHEPEEESEPARVEPAWPGFAEKAPHLQRVK